MSGSVQEVQFQHKKTQPGSHNGNKADVKTGNRKEMKRKVADVERDSITRMKSELLQRQRVIIVAKWDTGREYVEIGGQCTKSRRLGELSMPHTSLVQHVMLLKRVNIGRQSYLWIPLEQNAKLTGADVTVISEDTFYTFIPERRLEPPSIPLDRPGGELLCLGHFDVTISHKGSHDHSQLMWFSGLGLTISSARLCYLYDSCKFDSFKAMIVEIYSE